MSETKSLKHIANHLGFSMATVSRVLNGKAQEFRISDKTVKLIKTYAKQIKYTPNLIAKGLQSSKSFTIGLIIPDITNPFFSLIAKNVEKAASNSNYSILLIDSEESIEKEEKQIGIMLGRNVDAIIAVPVGIRFNHFESITKRNIPLIFVDRYSKELGIPYVSSDNALGGYMATKHLINNGHEKIALIKGNDAIEPVRERRRGYEKAMNEIKCLNKELIIGDDFSIKNGYDCTVKLLSLSNGPTAIFAMSNLIGLGVLRALKKNVVLVPVDISLIFFDNQPYTEYLNPPITTIKQSTESMGELAIDFILNILEHPNTQPNSVLLPPKLISRASVATILKK